MNTLTTAPFGYSPARSNLAAAGLNGPLTERSPSALSSAQDHYVPSAPQLTSDDPGFLVGKKPGCWGNMLAMFRGKAAWDAACQAPTGMFGKGMAIVGVAGGAWQMGHGINQLRDGKVVEGSLTTVAGAATVTTGVASGGTAVGLTSAFAKRLGPGAFGVAAVAEGIKDVYTGCRDGNGEKIGVGGAKTVAGGLLIAGACTGNPILMGSGAVLYAGAWAYENRDAIKQGAVAVGSAIKDGAVAVKDGAVAAATAVKDGAVAAATAVKDGAVAVTSAAVNCAASAANTVTQAAKGLGSKVKGVWNWITS